jgi:hypothetical protein
VGLKKILKKFPALPSPRDVCLWQRSRGGHVFVLYLMPHFSEPMTSRQRNKLYFAASSASKQADDLLALAVASEDCDVADERLKRKELREFSILVKENGGTPKYSDACALSKVQHDRMRDTAKRNYANAATANVLATSAAEALDDYDRENFPGRVFLSSVDWTEKADARLVFFQPKYQNTHQCWFNWADYPGSGYVQVDGFPWGYDSD